MVDGQEYALDSILALQRIPHDSLEGRDALESIATSWLNTLNQSKWPRGLQYFENASYLVGNHLTRYYYTAEQGLGVHTFGISDRSPYDGLVAKVADNKLLRPTESVVGLLTETSPEPRVEPNSELPEDEDAAKIAELYIQLISEHPLRLADKRREAVMTALITGTAIAETEYRETGYPIEIPKTVRRKSANPFYDPREPEGPDNVREVEIEETDPSKTEVVMRKDMSLKIWTPFHIDVDPQATRVEDITWIARSTYEDVDWIKDTFDKKGPGYYPEGLEGLGPQNAGQHILYWWAKFQDILESPQYAQHGGGFTSNSVNFSGGYAPNQTLFSVVDVKPSRDFPRGRTLIFAGGKLCYAGDARAWSSEYPWRWHPYSFFSWFKLPGKFWGTPLLTELIPLQKKINAIDAIVHANRQYIGVGQWMIPKHAKMREGGPSGLPGENFTYTDAGPGSRAPEKVRNIPLPGELLTERADLIKSINEIAAAGVVDSNQVTGSAARARAMLDFFRQEKLRSKSPMISDYQMFLESIAQNLLIEAQLNLLEEDPELTQRLQMAAREHSSLSVQAFTGASLRDHHTVRIDISSDLRHSPEATEAKAMEFYQFSGGQLTPQEREAVTKAINLDKFIKNEEDASVKRARRMISRIVTGDVDTAFPMPRVDVARAMAPVFQNEILSDRFHDHPKDVKGKLMEMFDLYAQLAAEEAQRQMEQQIALAQAGVK
jgi:hypothetical protein